MRIESRSVAVYNRIRTKVGSRPFRKASAVPSKMKDEVMKGKIRTGKEIGQTGKMLWGSFVEQMGRAIYGGIYDPGNPKADENGFRQDVLESVRRLKLPIVRYPGGNFVSGYDWKDGIGRNRPRRLNLAWSQIEPNTIGLHEFYHWACLAGTEVMMAVNLGTASLRDAIELVEYTNFEGDTQWAGLRRSNGREKPFGFRYWCLGNEMDGEWQIGSLPAEDYACKAREVSKLIKVIDPKIRTTLVGSSAPDLPTYPAWEKTVLDIAYEQVDYVSLHRYYSYPERGGLRAYLEQDLDLIRYIETVSGIVQETKRRKNSAHDVRLALDEWNVWHRKGDSSANRWQVSDVRVENRYDFADAMLVAEMICAIANHCDWVKIGCFAQLINVIGLIMTENGGRMYEQTSYYPFAFASNFLNGKIVESFVDGENADRLRLTLCAHDGGFSLLAVNGDERESAQLSLKVPADSALSAQIMCAAPGEKNSFEEPKKVVPRAVEVLRRGEEAVVEMPPFSMLMLRCG